MGRYLVPAVLLALAIYFIFQVHHVLLPFVLAATLAYLLNPLTRLLEVRGIRHRIAALGVFMLFMSLVLAAGYGVITAAGHEASRLSTDWPRVTARFQELAIIGRALLDRFPALEPIAQKLLSRESAYGVLEKTPSMALHALPIVEITFLVPFLTLFFLLDGGTLRDKALGLVPARYVEMMLSILVEIDNSLGNYVRGLCIQALFLGLLAGIGFSVIGLHYSVQIAVWVAATSMIPLVGAISAALAGGLVALVQWGTVAGVVKVLAISTGIRLLDDWLLHPLILRRAIHIHPAVTVFSLMAGGSLFGIWGLLFAVPVFCMVKVLMEVVWQWYRSEYGFQPPHPLPEISHIPLI